MGDKEFEFLPCLRGGAAGGGVYEGYNTAAFCQASAWRLCLLCLLGILGVCGLFYQFRQASAWRLCILGVQGILPFHFSFFVTRTQKGEKVSVDLLFYIIIESIQKK